MVSLEFVGHFPANNPFSKCGSSFSNSFIFPIISGDHFFPSSPTKCNENDAFWSDGLLFTRRPCTVLISFTFFLAHIRTFCRKIYSFHSYKHSRWSLITRCLICRRVASILSIVLCNDHNFVHQLAWIMGITALMIMAWQIKIASAARRIQDG